MACLVFRDPMDDGLLLLGAVFRHVIAALVRDDHLVSVNASGLSSHRLFPVKFIRI